MKILQNIESFIHSDPFDKKQSHWYDQYYDSVCVSIRSFVRSSVTFISKLSPLPSGIFFSLPLQSIWIFLYVDVASSDQTLTSTPVVVFRTNFIYSH